MKPTPIAASAAFLLFTATLGFAAEPRIERDIPYAQPKNPRHTLDVFAPAGASNRPVVFWIHGGGWARGDKKEVNVKPALFTGRDFVFVATNYRFVPQATIREITGDVARALAWTHRNAASYGGEPNTIFVMGHSAGAQLAWLCWVPNLLLVERVLLAGAKGAHQARSTASARNDS